MTPPLDTNKGEPMKTLPEILRDYFREVVDKAIEKDGESIVEFAERSKAIRENHTEAIAKELMGIIGEDEEVDTLEGHNVPSWDEMRRQAAQIARNQLKATQRARLTAFIGRDSNENS